MIPKIIWQTYECDYKDLPTKALEFSNSWKNKNPDWEYRYVSGLERSEFVLNNFGKEWFDIYNSYKANVLRADLWRYMCLYINGGLYADLDIVCNDSIEDFFDLNNSFIASKEPSGPGYSQMIFASNPKNIFLETVLKNIKNKHYENNIYNNIIDYTINETGYIIFTNSILETINSKNIDNIDFILYDGEMANTIHKKSINHYGAGTKKEIFGKEYIAWQEERFL
jgi:mannosyltransferase OCH1-like enzyme